MQYRDSYPRYTSADIVVCVAARIEADQFKPFMQIKPDRVGIAGLGLQENSPPLLGGCDFLGFVHQALSDAFAAELLRHPEFGHQEPV